MMHKLQHVVGLLSLILFVSYIYLSLALFAPPGAVPELADPLDFSAERALKHLKVIAKEPHSSGTPAHEKVKDYLVEYCKSMGLEVKVQEATGFRDYGWLVNAGRAQNVIARLKGTNSQKTILIMSHYDSQPNTPGAADDGAGIAAMLETIRALKTGQKLKNDVVFLMTDLEEVGLLGAEAFVSQEMKAEEIGILLNFESRGNSGVSLTFEVSSQNGWLMQQFAQAAKYPFASSLAYEVYKLIPNDSDFTLFKDTKISGLNSAFIEGFSNYHSMTDTPENINLGSLQHHGVHMLDLIRHFDLQDLHHTQAPDTIFFNILGAWMVLYPISWDWPLIMLTSFLFIIVVFVGSRKKRFEWPSFFRGILYLMNVLLLTLGATVLLAWGVSHLYPYYSNFYAANFYNATDYLYTLMGFSILFFTLFFAWFGQKYHAESMSLGGTSVLMLLMYIVKNFMDTGAFIFYVPLLAFFLVQLILFLGNIDQKDQPIVYVTAQWISCLPIIGMWIPFIYMFFIVFSWSMPQIAVVLMVLMTPLVANIAPVIPAKWLGGLAVFFIFFGIIKGHIGATYSPKQPLQSNLFYAHNQDTQKAYWGSVQKHLDEWNSQYIQTNEKVDFSGFFPGWELFRQETQYTEISGSTLEVTSDTTIEQKRKMLFKLTPGEETNSIELRFPPQTKVNQLNERKLSSSGAEGVRLRYFAPPKEGIQISCEFPMGETSVVLLDRKLGLPEDLLKYPMPPHIIKAPNYYSHVILSKKTVTF